jgi:hypothetical protein
VLPVRQEDLLHNHARRPPRQPQPGERLFEVLIGHDRLRCELRDHGRYGIEAQFFRNEPRPTGRFIDSVRVLNRTPEYRRADYDVRMRTSYSRRQGDYAYDIQVHDVARPVNADHRFCAIVVNLVRREAGQTISVNAGPQDAYGVTPDEAVSRIETTVETWVHRHTRSREHALPPAAHRT